MRQATTGLVIGKFMPPHNGHLALIEFARQRCGNLIVLVGARPGEPIPGPLRLEWLRSLADGNGRVRVDYTEDDLPEAPAADRRVSRAWADYLRRRYPDVDVVFSSEAYGGYLAEFMGILHLPFDPGRKAHAVSGTAIRENPLRHWGHLPPPVRAHYVKKVCVYGPESTGKTVMTERLARRFNTAFVPEMARVLFPDRMPAHEGEMRAIAEAHAREIVKTAPQADRVMFVDTDHLTTKIYWQDMFGRTPDFEPWICQANRHDLYLLLDIDVPWVADPLRESGQRRGEHLARFRAELEAASAEYVLIGGGWEERQRRAEEEVVGRWPELKGRTQENKGG